MQVSFDSLIRTEHDVSFTGYHTESVKTHISTYTPLFTHGEPPVVQLLKNSPALYGNRRFSAVFTRASTGTYPEPDQFNPYHPILYL
jgi:hypothetical protein